MELLTTREFNGVALDCYKADNEADGFWATREQIGRLLGYTQPDVSIRNIHSRNRERLDKFSTRINLIQVEGNRTVTREVIVYNFKGFLEICRYSDMPKADAVIDFAWNVMDKIRRTGSYGKPFTPTIKKGVVSAQTILDFTGCFTGRSVRYVSFNNTKI